MEWIGWRTSLRGCEKGRCAGRRYIVEEEFAVKDGITRAMRSTVCIAGKSAVCVLAGLLAGTGGMQAQAKLASAAPVTYDNKYELFGGLNFQNFQAGQRLPERMNLGGLAVSGTYWLTGKLGLAADFRGDAGTTPVFPSINKTLRPLVVLYTGMVGAQYRGPKNQRAAINYHAYGGVSHGDFRLSRSIGDVGLYTNRTKPIFALGGSVDFNRTKNLAIRLSPDLILEHFGTETREFFAISGGVIYRFGQR